MGCIQYAAHGELCTKLSCCGSVFGCLRGVCIYAGLCLGMRLFVVVKRVVVLLCAREVGTAFVGFVRCCCSCCCGAFVLFTFVVCLYVALLWWLCYGLVSSFLWGAYNMQLIVNCIPNQCVACFCVVADV